MQFKDIAFKNFKYNIRKYTAYFVGNCFSIMAFFLVASIIYNKDVAKHSLDFDLPGAIQLYMIIIFCFSVFFILYSYSSFMKTRLSEFGLFLSLGMSNKDIGKLIIFENFLTMVGSLCVGMGLGTVFSRFFLIAVSKFIGINDIGFNLGSGAFIVTSILFTIIFFITTIANLAFVNKLEITNLLKKSKENEKMLVYHPAYGFLGILLMIVAIVVLQIFLNGTPVIISLIILGMYMLSMYLVTSQFGNLIISLIKRKKNIYYPRLINVTSIKSRFNQYNRIFFAVSILIMVVIFGSGLIFSYYIGLPRSTVDNYPVNLCYVQALGYNNLPEASLNELLKKSSTPITEKKEMEFLIVKSTNCVWQFGKDYDVVVVISEKELSRNKKIHSSIKSGNADIIPNYYYKGDKSIVDMYYNYKEHRLPVIKEINADSESFYSVLINQFSFTKLIAVINEQDYQSIRGNIGSQYVGKFIGVNFINWKGTGPVINSVTNALKRTNPQTRLKTGDLKLNGTLIYYNNSFTYIAFQVFMFSFIAILFLVAVTEILYFKLYSEFGEVLAKYRMLNKIGITSKEIKKQINLDVGLVYFIPAIIGSIYGYVLICFFFTQGSYHYLVFYSLLVIFVFLGVQTINYYIASRSYSNKIISNL